eukprot:10979772-Alexandrium_andersonii.AAC.1
MRSSGRPGARPSRPTKWPRKRESSVMSPTSRAMPQRRPATCSGISGCRTFRSRPLAGQAPA